MIWARSGKPRSDMPPGGKGHGLPPARGLRRIAGAAVPVTLAVQVCSFASSVALASFLGATPETDAYYLALSVPVLVYGILLAGTRLGAIPALTEANRRDPAEFDAGTRSLMGWILLVTTALAVVVSALVVFALPLLGSGAPSETIDTARVMVWELAPMTVIGALIGSLGAMLTVRRYYVFPIAIGAFEPLVKIALLVLAAPALGAQALVLGNLVGGALGVIALLLLGRRAGLKLRPTWKETRFVRAVLAVSGPLILAEAVLQFNPIIDRLFAAPLGGGSVTVLELGLRLFNVPMMLFASTLIAPVLAIWSDRFQTTGWSGLRESLMRALALILWLMPLMVALGTILSDEVVTLLYRGGDYSSADVADTADVFMFFVLGLPAQVAVVALASVFVVRKDVVVPATIALANVVLNLACNAWLSQALGVGGIALSTTLTSTLLAGAYVLTIHRRYGSLGLRRLGRRAAAVGVASAGAVAVALAIKSGLSYPTDRASAASQLLLAGPIMVAVYLLAMLVARESPTKWKAAEFAPQTDNF